MAIIGESGSGKSVLTKCIDGLLDYDSGFISYDKINIKELNSKKKNAYMIRWNSFSKCGFVDSLTIEERNLRFAKKGVIFRKS